MARASGFSPHCGTTYWPNGTSTTIEPEWSAAIGLSSAGRVVGMDGTPSGLPGQPASRGPEHAPPPPTAGSRPGAVRCLPGAGRPGPPRQPVHGRPGQQRRADQREQGHPVGLAEGGQPGHPDEPGVRHEGRDPQPAPALGQRHVRVPPDLQHRAERERRTAQPQQREQPGAPPSPADDQARHGEQAQHHPERVQVLQGGLPEVDMAQASPGSSASRGDGANTSWTLATHVV